MPSHSSETPRWSLVVDLTGGNFPGGRSVIVEGDWDATPQRIREMAAEHYGVRLSQVAHPKEHRRRRTEAERLAGIRTALEGIDAY